MGPQSSHRLPRLRFDLRPHRLFFRIRGASEEEILPGEHPALVAEVVEVVTFVDASTPHSDEIDVGKLRLFDSALVSRPVDSMGERIVGDPVCPANEDRLAVDDDRERRACGIWRGVKRNRAKRDPLVHQIDGVIAGDETNLKAVKGLVSVAARPPPGNFRHSQAHHTNGLTGRNLELGVHRAYHCANEHRLLGHTGKFDVNVE